ncbi:hypothetical protein [uncultured Lacinutrix sp.]|uniref:hypothetical protein n=1 Tax=uncultured Lacinutrix sp. TaxID=574032 RepID=UPI00261DDD82|nr:hypothetical protein [uncultured Lacinutrix sp.]
MRTYVADIIPKIQRFSEKLDNSTMLTAQHWVVLDELTQSKTVYIFRDNAELLIVINGKVEKAKWEYLGQNSILIDLKEESYLFRHGFFDKNILALKIDSKEEYAVLINESKYNGELNSIDTVIHFLNQNYLVNPIITNKQLGPKKLKNTNVIYQKNGYTFKMGFFKEFLIRFDNGQSFNIYQKKSNGKYFISSNKEIILFSEKQDCIKYLERHML